MLNELLLLPGRFICRMFSSERKRYRYYSRNSDKGAVVVLSFLGWVVLFSLGFLLVNILGTNTEPLEPVSAPRSEQTAVANTTDTLSSASQQTQTEQQPVAGSITVPVAPETPPEAWLVIVESIPKSARQEAEQALVRQNRKGLNLELVDTDAYPLLKSGMWTLALGPFDSRAEAEVAAQTIKPKVKDLMIRRGL